MRKMKMNIIYTIVRNESNEIIFVTDNFNSIKTFVTKHFPKYTISEKYNMIILNSKNFTLSKTVMNYDIITGEEYE